MALVIILNGIMFTYYKLAITILINCEILLGKLWV